MNLIVIDEGKLEEMKKTIQNLNLPEDRNFYSPLYIGGRLDGNNSLIEDIKSQGVRVTINHLNSEEVQKEIKEALIKMMRGEK